MSSQDSYALSDTLVADVYGSLMAAAAVAVPDYVPKGKGRRTLTRLGIAGLGAAGMAVLNRFDEDPEDDKPAKLREQMKDTPVEGNTPAAVGVLGLGVGLAALGQWASMAAGRAGEKFLTKRGVQRPWTWMGVGYGALTFLQLRYSDRSVGARADHV